MTKVFFRGSFLSIILSDLLQHLVLKRILIVQGEEGINLNSCGEDVSGTLSGCCYVALHGIT